MIKKYWCTGYFAWGSVDVAFEKITAPATDTITVLSQAIQTFCTLNAKNIITIIALLL